MLQPVALIGTVAAMLTVTIVLTTGEAKIDDVRFDLGAVLLMALLVAGGILGTFPWL